jgi:GAF domain-containing protein
MNATPDSTLTDSERLIAGLQRELAECKAELTERTAERDEALAQQTATAEVLQAINSAPGDLAPVFDAILEKAQTLCDAASGSLMLYDGASFRAAAVYSVSEAFAERLREGFPVLGYPFAQRLVDGAGFVHVSDLAESDHPVARAAVELTGARTRLMVPLRKDDVLLGAISIVRREVRPFTDKQIALLQNFAAQAVIAIENARLLTETREALEQQTATAEVLGVINASPGDLGPVFDAILEKAHALCGAAQGILVIRAGEEFRLAAVHGEPGFVEAMQQVGAPAPRPVEGSLSARLIRGEPLIHLADAQANAELPPRIQRLSKAWGVRTLLAVPLRKDDVFLGYITAYRQEVRPFTERQIALLQSFAAQAVIAMENARLLTETREALDQQTATAEVLHVINSSPGDLQPVFDAILERAHHFCDASLGSFVLRAGERWPAVATRGYSAQHDEIARREGLPNDAPALRQLARGEVVHTPDLALLAAPNPVTRAAVESGSRTYLAVPLRKDGILLGYLSAHRQEVRLFSDKQIALL